MVGPLQDRRDAEAVRHLGRHVLHRVNGDVGCALLHRHLEFLDEQALAADLLQAAIEDLVAAGRQRHEFDVVDVVDFPQQGGYVLGLPEGERALARGNSDQQAV